MADTPEHEQPKADFKSEIASALPAVESPSISPAVTEPAREPVAEAPKSEAVTAVAAASDERPASAATAPSNILSLPNIRLTARHKRYGLLAASVVFAAALGAVVGAAASGGFAAAKPDEFARAEDSKAMQQTIARLGKEVAVLKANVEAANKSAHAQIAKIGDKLSRDSAEITGSISPPQTVAAPPAVPLPKPRIAAVGTQAPARTPVLQDWIIRDVRDGYVYVQGRGDIFEVSIGAPLPGLGRVEQVKRQDGRWMVVTPKGLIVSLRDRRYFE